VAARGSHGAMPRTRVVIALMAPPRRVDMRL
jgi:hypothetical protein